VSELAGIPDNDFKHAVDRIVVSGKRVFGWGWAAHRTRTVKSIHLRVEGDGWQQRIPTGIGLARDDVERAFPDHANSGASGFVVAGHIPASPALRSWLDVEFDEGPAASIEVTGQMDGRDSARQRLRLVSWLARSVWRRLRRGDLAGIVRRARAQSFGVPSIGDVSALDEIAAALGDARVTLVIDHNMGGGANHYRREVLAQRAAAGEAALLCTYNLPALEYRVHLFRPGNPDRVWATSSFTMLERLVEEGRVAELFVNSPVSFDEPLVLAEWLARMRTENRGVRLTLTTHDYFTVCPSFVLLDADGRFCGIPSISECDTCLRRHEASYVALSPPSDMGPWRALWGRCLAVADEVRCFSGASRALLLRAYPALDPARVTVVPHKVDFHPPRAPRSDPAAPLVIGVMGEISPQKGAHIVTGLVREIERRAIDARVVVLGTLHAAVKSPRLRVTGAYERGQLVDLVEEHGINMLLFPSIWPETFSYVVAEMMALDMPVVAFDLGAPAERLRGYARARMCAEASAPSALATLMAFHRELAAAVRPAA
jgi:glycosyltransferase involved in cell wall biosynthesis